MDTTIEELTLLLLSLTATRDPSAGDIRMRTALTYPAAALAALRERGLIDEVDDTSAALTAAGIRLAEKLEDQYLDGDERPDVAA